MTEHEESAPLAAGNGTITKASVRPNRLQRKFDLGHRSGDVSVHWPAGPPPCMKRYRTACGAVTADVSFDWYRAKIKRKQEGGDHSQALETVKDLTLTERPKS
jgi:hypothetical protein